LPVSILSTLPLHILLKRAKEIGIRKVIGGRRKQLIIQFLGESFILSFYRVFIGDAIYLAGIAFFNTLTNKALSFSYLFNIKLVTGYTCLFLATGLLAGFLFLQWFYHGLILCKPCPGNSGYPERTICPKGWWYSSSHWLPALSLPR